MLQITFLSGFSLSLFLALTPFGKTTSSPKSGFEHLFYMPIKYVAIAFLLICNPS